MTLSERQIQTESRGTVTTRKKDLTAGEPGTLGYKRRSHDRAPGSDWETEGQSPMYMRHRIRETGRKDYDREAEINEYGCQESEFGLKKDK